MQAMNERKVKVISPENGFTGLKAQKLGRNALCRCGSGLKAKRCCGNTTAYFSRDKLKISAVGAPKKQRENESKDLLLE